MADASNPESTARAAAEVAGRDAISGRLVVCLGLSQLIGWGTMHYLIAVFGGSIAFDLGLGSASIQSGFSLALVVMGATSGLVGRWIDAHGGRVAMMAGCWCGAAGCALLATTHGPVQYYCGWLLLGLGMRLGLYDAAFASLARVGGASSKRAMSQITLFGGLASTVFWPLGQFLLQTLGWRGALAVYAMLLMLASGLHFALPVRRRGPADALQGTAALAPATGPVAAAADKLLYGFIAAAVMFIQLGFAAHLIELLRGVDWGATMAVGLASLFGLGQFSGRAWVVAWGYRINAVRLNLVPAALLCGCFLIYLFAGTTIAGAAAFAFFYGTGNGIATVTRGSMPLVLFDTAHYGRIVGAILKPAFMLSAAAPVAFALAIGWWGHEQTVALALLLSIALLGASVALAVRFAARQHAA